MFFFSLTLTVHVVSIGVKPKVKSHCSSFAAVGETWCTGASLIFDCWIQDNDNYYEFLAHIGAYTMYMLLWSRKFVINLVLYRLMHYNAIAK